MPKVILHATIRIYTFTHLHILKNNSAAENCTDVRLCQVANLSIFYNILGFRHPTVLILVFDGVKVKTTNTGIRTSAEAVIRVLSGFTSHRFCCSNTFRATFSAIFPSPLISTRVFQYSCTLLL